MPDKIDWKLVESRNGIKIIKSEVPYFRNSILQNMPLDSKEFIQKFKNNGVCDIYGNLTERGRIVAISCLGLEEQCKILGIKINYESINVNNGTEISALEFYKEHGYTGNISVFQIITDIIYSICFDKLYPLHIKKYGDKRSADSYSGCLYGFMEYFEKLKFDLIYLIKSSNDKIVEKNFKKILEIDNLYYKDLRKYRNISQDIVIRTYKCIGNEDISKIGMLILSNNPYIYSTGWPDLMLIKDNRIRFVEVKRKDKLKKSQIITIGDLKKITNLNLSVLEII